MGQANLQPVLTTSHPEKNERKKLSTPDDKTAAIVSSREMFWLLFNYIINITDLRTKVHHW